MSPRQFPRGQPHFHLGSTVSCGPSDETAEPRIPSLPLVWATLLADSPPIFLNLRLFQICLSVGIIFPVGYTLITRQIWCGACATHSVIRPLTAAGSAAIRSGAQVARTHTKSLLLASGVCTFASEVQMALDRYRQNRVNLSQENSKINKTSDYGHFERVLDVQGKTQPLDPWEYLLFMNSWFVYDNLLLTFFSPVIITLL